MCTLMVVVNVIGTSEFNKYATKSSERASYIKLYNKLYCFMNWYCTIYKPIMKFKYDGSPHIQMYFT